MMREDTWIGHVRRLMIEREHDAVACTREKALKAALGLPWDNVPLELFDELPEDTLEQE